MHSVTFCLYLGLVSCLISSSTCGSVASSDFPKQYTSAISVPAQLSSNKFMVYYDEVYGASRMDFIVSEGVNTTNLCIFNKSSNKVLAYSLLTDAVTPVVPSLCTFGTPLDLGIWCWNNPVLSGKIVGNFSIANRTGIGYLGTQDDFGESIWVLDANRTILANLDPEGVEFIFESTILGPPHQDLFAKPEFCLPANQHNTRGLKRQPSRLENMPWRAPYQ